MTNAEKAVATYEILQQRKRQRQEGQYQAKCFIIKNTLRRKKESRC